MAVHNLYLSDWLQTASSRPAESTGCERRGMRSFVTGASWLSRWADKDSLAGKRGIRASTLRASLL